MVYTRLQSPHPEGALTIEQVAERLVVSPHTVRALISQGELPSFRLNDGPKSRARVMASDLKAWIESRKEAEEDR
jgi:excisionase family DNA binding protein